MKNFNSLESLEKLEENLIKSNEKIIEKVFSEKNLKIQWEKIFLD